MLPEFKRCWILTGPTGSGKTEIALAWAERIGAEIVSMDSMALFRRMDIGTAKPTAEERGRVRHHLVDVLDPWQSASVAWWLDQARLNVADIEGRGKRALFVGGTPLYLKALISGLFEGPPANAELRDRLATLPNPHARLAEVDPTAAARLHPNDTRRVIRALEVFELTGRPISDWQEQWRGETPTPENIVWIDRPREKLYDRINRRVEAMFTAGLIEEVRSLLQMKQPLSPEARQALGYKEVIGHLHGEKPLAETIAEVQIRTRNFAKRQMTWFRHLPGCRPIRPEMAITELTVGPQEPTMTE